jgi:hypothetical protein
LDKNDYEIVWTLLGEKNVWGGQRKSDEVFQKAISGVYALNAEKVLTGGLRILDRS